MKIFRSEKAERDLLQIYGYLADRNPQAADALIEEIDAKFTNQKWICGGSPRPPHFVKRLLEAIDEILLLGRAGG